MELVLNINDEEIGVTIRPGDTLLKVLRGLGYFGVKHGCESGDCGACAVLLDGKPVNTCVTLAAQAAGHRLKTIESVGQHPAQGWKTTRGLHPLQQAFVESGAIQCGYCTPAQILAALELIQRNPDPSEAEVRDALSGVLGAAVLATSNLSRQCCAQRLSCAVSRLSQWLVLLPGYLPQRNGCPAAKAFLPAMYYPLQKVAGSESFPAASFMCDIISATHAGRHAR